MSDLALANSPALIVGAPGSGGGGTPGAPRGAALVWGNNSVGSTVATRYLTPGFGDVPLASIAPIQFRMPFTGTLRNLRVRHNTPAGNGNAIVYTVRLNGAPTPIVATIASNAADGSDLANAVLCAAGDLVDIEITKALGVATSPTNVVAVLQVSV